MPSMDDVPTPNSNETAGDAVELLESENEWTTECTDTSSSRGSDSPPNKLSSLKVFGLSNKIKSETRKLLGYPGKAIKRPASLKVNSNNSEERENQKLAEDARIHKDFSSYFKEHDILMEL